MIHQYKLGGYNIVLDVCSGSVHVVDEVAYDIISMFEDYAREDIEEAMQKKYADREDITSEDIAECYAQVKSLQESGKLFAPDTFEPMAGKLKEKTAGVVKALCLHIAHTCNLNCSYCFASQGKYNGERAVMSFEVGKRALDFLIENSGTRHNLEVDFFGGEPLMNFQVVKDLVAYARSIEKEHNKNFRFTITTNGVLVDDD
ncbi:MAG: 4Fe-4S cluster-binding domain-containing protein, partial [Clostridia bacterium]|nr:4Fe-4S cluster-binding domain-containing protein [Clostridia bacterium]